MQNYTHIETKSQDKGQSETIEQWGGNTVKIKASIFHNGEMCQTMGESHFEMTTKPLQPNIPHHKQSNIPHYLMQKHVLQDLEKVEGDEEDEYICKCGKKFRAFCIRPEIISIQKEYQSKTYENPGKIVKDKKELTSVQNVIKNAREQVQLDKKNLDTTERQIDQERLVIENAELAMQELWRQAQEDELCTHVERFIQLIKEQHNLQFHYYDAPDDHTQVLRQILMNS